MAERDQSVCSMLGVRSESLQLGPSAQPCVRRRGGSSQGSGPLIESRTTEGEGSRGLRFELPNEFSTDSMHQPTRRLSPRSFHGRSYELRTLGLADLTANSKRCQRSLMISYDGLQSGGAHMVKGLVERLSQEEALRASVCQKNY